MARKPPSGICVHCLKMAQKRNWDHVFPQGWYPDTTPQNLEKWKIPTCKNCNDEYGKIEDELGIILSACVDPTSSQASGIWKKTLRALDPSQGKNERDRNARDSKRKNSLPDCLKEMKFLTMESTQDWGNVGKDPLVSRLHYMCLLNT